MNLSDVMVVWAQTHNQIASLYKIYDIITLLKPPKFSRRGGGQPSWP